MVSNWTRIAIMTKAEDIAKIEELCWKKTIFLPNFNLVKWESLVHLNHTTLAEGRSSKAI
jgi:hypothetical protein